MSGTYASGYFDNEECNIGEDDDVNDFGECLTCGEEIDKNSDYCTKCIANAVLGEL